MGLFTCLGIFAAGMQEDVRYIRCLEKEVAGITRGNLMKHVTVKGKDELAQLAYGLDQMRLELLKKEQTEQEMRLAQERLALGMSHDLRTPLTGLMTYLEIIKKQESEGRASKEYIGKALDKVQQIRRLTDQTFEYFLVHSQREVIMEDAEEIKSALGDYLSEMCALLECDGFQIDADKLKWKPVQVQVNTDYLGRIVNNIISNLKKYGDRTRKVEIKMIYAPCQVGIFIKNAIASDSKYIKGTGLGVKNITLMMAQMNGKAEVRMSNKKYCMILYFPVFR